jgi:hypothetical protein
MSAGNTAPFGAAAALLYAVVKSPWAVIATASPAWKAPVVVPGGKPVIEAAGHMPTSPPTTLVGPTLLTTGVAPRIPKLHAVPKGEGAGSGVGGIGHGAEVVNVQTKLAASGFPKVSVAPVVTVAVKVVLAGRAAVGVKVATLVATT